MFEDINAWFSSLNSWQAFLLEIGVLVVFFIIRWMIVDAINDGVKKGIKNAYKEIKDEEERKLKRER